MIRRVSGGETQGSSSGGDHHAPTRCRFPRHGLVGIPIRNLDNTTDVKSTSFDVSELGEPERGLVACVRLLTPADIGRNNPSIRYICYRRT